MSSVQTRQRPQTADGCPECAGDVRQDGDESVCTDCGLVVDADRLDRGPEWLTSCEPDRSRVGRSRTLMLHDSGLGSRFDAREGDGKKLTWLQELNDRFESSHDQNQAKGLGEINRVAAALDLTTDRREQTAKIFRQAHDDGFLVGRCIDDVASAVVYAVARIHELPITLGDVVGVSRVDHRRVAVAYRALNREYGLPTPPPDPSVYLPRIASEVGLGQRAHRRAERFLQRWQDDRSGSAKTPAGVAAGAVYLSACFAAEKDFSQADVAEAAGVAPSTVRARRDDLAEVVGGDA